MMRRPFGGTHLFTASCVPALAAIVTLMGLAACDGARARKTEAIAPTAAPCTDRVSCARAMAARLEAVRGDAAELERLLARFPKGGDLHNHLAGAVYAESYLDWAREDGLRVDGSSKLVDGSCDPSRCSPLPSPSDPRYAALVHAWSMKDFTPGAESGHDRFFAAFARFGLASHEAKRQPFMLAEAIRRAAEDRALYLETLVTVDRPPMAEVTRDAGEISSSGQGPGSIDPHEFAAFERKLRADPRWVSLVQTAREALVANEKSARAVLGCDKAPRPPACDLTVRFLAQVGRTAALAHVFTEALVAFEVGAIERSLVGLNLVSPEDDATAVRDYDAQMAAIAFLKQELGAKSPLRITLHAGELTPALCPAPALKAHIRNAVEVAGAERIGHGVDVLGEEDAGSLLAEMHKRGVTVEVCLSSNATILGVEGAAHPLAAYLAAGVPVTLATDDPGVSRSSLTREYSRAVRVQGLGYGAIKAMARRSLEAAFVPGASLWASLEKETPVAACPLPERAGDAPTPACSAFLASSERARLSWQLETQLAAFESE